MQRLGIHATSEVLVAKLERFPAERIDAVLPSDGIDLPDTVHAGDQADHQRHCYFSHPRVTLIEIGFVPLQVAEHVECRVGLPFLEQHDAEVVAVDRERQLAEGILGELSKPYNFGGEELAVSASLGASVYPWDGEDAQTLLRNAENALHAAKRQGRNRIRLYAPTLGGSGFEKLQLKLNQTLQHAAGETAYPWADEERDRWTWVRNFGAAAAMGMGLIFHGMVEFVQLYRIVDGRIIGI